MYSSDLKDKDWETIRHYFEFSNGYGNRAIHPRRNLVNGILYVVKTGCQWRMLPKDFPPWKTVYGYFRRLSKLGVWEKVLKDLVKIKSWPYALALSFCNSWCWPNLRHLPKTVASRRVSQICETKCKLRKITNKSSSLSTKSYFCINYRLLQIRAS